MRKILLALLLAFGFAAPTAARTSLTVGKADAGSSAIIPVNVGEKVGIFAKHGLDLKISDFTGGSKLIQAMTAGSIDIGVGAGPLMALELRGAPILAVCNDAPAMPFVGIVVPWDSTIHSVDALKGAKIGISSAGSLTDWLAQQLARNKGWGPDGLTVVAVGNALAGMVAAFRTHELQAAVLTTADIFKMESNHEGRLLIPVSDYVGNVAAGAIFATRSLITSDPTAIRDFIAGWLETISYMRAHRAQAITLESEVTGFTPAVQTQEFDHTISMFSSTCAFDSQSLANLKQSFIDLKKVSSPPDMAKLYTSEFVPQ